MRFSIILLIFLAIESVYGETCSVSEEQIRDLRKVASCGVSDDTFKCLEENGINLTKENKLPGAVGSALGAEASREAFVSTMRTENSEKKKTKTSFLNWFQNFFFSYAIADYNDNQARSAIQFYATSVERGIAQQRRESAEQLRFVHKTAHDIRVIEARQVEILADRDRAEQVKAKLMQWKRENPTKLDLTNRVQELVDKALKVDIGNTEDRKMAWTLVSQEIRSSVDGNFDDTPLFQALKVRSDFKAPAADPVKDMQFAADRNAETERQLADLEKQSSNHRINGDQYKKQKAALEEQKRVYAGVVQAEDLELKRLKFLDGTESYNRDFRFGAGNADRERVMAYFVATDGLADNPLATFHRDQYIGHNFPKTNNFVSRTHAEDKIREGRGLLATYHDSLERGQTKTAREFIQGLGKKAAMAGGRLASYAATGPVGAAMAAEDMAETMHGIIAGDLGCSHTENAQYITFQKCKPVPDILSSKMRNFLNIGNFEYQKKLMELNPALCDQMKKAVDLYKPTQWQLKCNDNHDGFVTLKNNGIAQEVKLNRDGSIRKIVLTQKMNLQDKVGGLVDIDRVVIDGGRTSFVMDNGKPQSLCVREDTYLNGATKQVATWVEGKNSDDMGCHPSYNKNIPMDDVDREGHYFPERAQKIGEKSLNFLRAHMFAMMEMSQCCGPNRDSANADRCLAYESHLGNKARKADPAPVSLPGAKNTK